MLGAILLTGYLGGAVAAHVRLGDPVWTHQLFGAQVGLSVARIGAWRPRTAWTRRVR
jgi:hypothetical protein